jgi:hypothetical protein
MKDTQPKMNQIEYGQGLTDPEYLREMAKHCRENVGSVVEWHCRRLEEIASRIEGLEHEAQYPRG